MNKRIFSIIMVAVMVCSVICVAVPEKALAASKKPYMTTWARDYCPREKVGGYYIWVDSEYENGTYFSSLKCAKSLKKGKAKTLRKVTSKTKELTDCVVTDGKNIYYSIGDWKKGTIYKTTVKGSKHKKVKTVKNLADLAGFYDGKLYYTVANPDYTLYSYDIAKKKTQMEKKDYLVDSSYGRYMIGGDAPETGEGCDYMHELYDAKTGKSSPVVKGYNTAIFGKTVYYATSTFNSSDGSTIFIQCNLSGKNKKTIKKMPKNITVSRIGRKSAYCHDWDTGGTKKLTYSTKKLTTVK